MIAIAPYHYGAAGVNDNWFLAALLTVLGIAFVCLLRAVIFYGVIPAFKNWRRRRRQMKAWNKAEKKWKQKEKC